jgi:hypothetical protein
MTDEDSKQPFLSRWSQRKLAHARETSAPQTPAPAAPAAPAAAANASANAPAKDAAAEPALPSVESLTFDSDFAAFMSPKVDESTRRQALRKLFRDPRFNVMDGLDVYIDDYTKFEPIPPDLLAKLEHAKFLFDPPKTRVNEHGHVEDVPHETADPETPEEQHVGTAEDPTALQSPDAGAAVTASMAIPAAPDKAR